MPELLVCWHGLLFAIFLVHTRQSRLTAAAGQRKRPSILQFHAQKGGIDMKVTAALRLLTSLTASLMVSSAIVHAADEPQEKIRHLVEGIIQPVMEQNDVPGLAVGITIGGKHYFFNYGLASKETGDKVTEDTLFEIGSLSKTFTATLAAYAQETGALSLLDPASKLLPELAGTSFDEITILALGTYTAGGLPLQVPEGVTEENMIDYYKNWQPEYEPDTKRLYSNPSIGLFGHIVAKSMALSFDDAMEDKLFPMLGLNSTYLSVPDEQMARYALGYNKDLQPVRVTPGLWDSEAYGIKTSTGDLLRFLDANMAVSDLNPDLKLSIATTQTGYYRVGGMVQGLGWEMYADPTDLDEMLIGNSVDVILKPNTVERSSDKIALQDGYLVNKTGSTNGFGAYAIFRPEDRMGVVLLANKNYPISTRVKAGYTILNALPELGAGEAAD
jgi:beta-lactamase class C